MTVEELLKPRYKVIADYPNATFKVGTIMTEDWAVRYAMMADELEFDKFPHLFRKLEWWEERDFDLAGMYIRAGDLDKRHACYKLKEKLEGQNLYGFWTMTGPTGQEHHYPLSNVTVPITEADYNEYIKTKTPQP